MRKLLISAALVAASFSTQAAVTVDNTSTLLCVDMESIHAGIAAQRNADKQLMTTLVKRKKCGYILPGNIISVAESRRDKSRNDPVMIFIYVNGNAVPAYTREAALRSLGVPRL